MSEQTDTDKIRDPDLASNTLSVVSTMLDQIDWDWLWTELERAEALGPILEPTAFQAAASSGSLARSQKAVSATRDYLKALHEAADDLEGMP